MNPHRLQNLLPIPINDAEATLELATEVLLTVSMTTTISTSSFILVAYLGTKQRQNRVR